MTLTVMTAQGETPVAPRNHNQPIDPFEAFKLELDSLFEEAGNFLDGEPIATQEQADDVSAILNRIRKATKDADAFRAAEKKPHDDAAKAVQVKWVPTIDRAKLAADAAKDALADFLGKQEAAQRAAAEAAAQEAREKAEAAAQAAQATRPDDLAGREQAKALQEEAAAAEKHAARLDKARPQAKGGERAVGLRTVYTAEVTDPIALGRWAWEHRRPEYLEFLTSLAASECRHGPRDIPGVKVHEDRKAV